jgi:hypothetical protein
VGWALALVLIIGVVIRLNRANGWRWWVGLAGLVIFVVGFGAPIFYAVEMPGPGPQWYALGLALTGWAWHYRGKAARPRSNSAG